jgi:hypothetical protein
VDTPVVVTTANLAASGQSVALELATPEHEIAGLVLAGEPSSLAYDAVVVPAQPALVGQQIGLRWAPYITAESAALVLTGSFVQLRLVSPVAPAGIALTRGTVDLVRSISVIPAAAGLQVQPIALHMLAFVPEAEMVLEGQWIPMGRVTIVSPAELSLLPVDHVGLVPGAVKYCPRIRLSTNRAVVRVECCEYAG